MGTHMRSFRSNSLDNHDKGDENAPIRTWAGKLNTQPIYGDGLQLLCRRTKDNLDNLSASISRGDPCVKYGIKHWHPDKRPASVAGVWRKQTDLQPTKGRWQDKNVMFTSADVMENIGKVIDDTSDTDSYISTSSVPVNKFCYLCTTLEEHQRHLLHNRKPKRPSTAKARIEYIAPKPRIKKKTEDDEEEDYVKENLYKMDVFTGDISNAGTDANVFVTIKGSRDILPKTPLKKGRGSSKFTFLRNTKETFYIKGPKLGNLEIVTIEHDGLEKKHGWFLDRIEITEMRFDLTWVFTCNQWLSLHIKDYMIKRDLIGKEQEVPLMEYQISVVTGKKRLAGTDANIYLTMYGKFGASKKIHLVDKSKKMFEKGSTDNFRVQMKNLGELQRIRIEHDDKGLASGWFLDRVLIQSAENPKDMYYFLYNGWIAKDVGDGQLWREIKAKKSLPKELKSGTKTTFHITVQTGNVRYAGTDANVFIQICGNKGMTEKLKLDDAKNNFEKGMIDEFQLEIIDVGRIEKILIGHDNSGPGAGWFLDWVKIRRYLPKQDVIDHLKQMKKKLKQKKRLKEKDNDTDSEDETSSRKKRKNQKARRNSKIRSDVSESSSDSDAEKSSQKERKKKLNKRKKKEEEEDELSMRVPLYEEYEFICKKWLAIDEGDGLTEREISVDDRTMYYRD